MIDFNRMPYIYWSSVTKASVLQRQIIVHSILYYEMSETVIEDFQFDSLSKQLVELRKQMSESEYKRTQYYYCFEDFDGSTGFYLHDALNECDKKQLQHIARIVLYNYKSGGGGKA